MAMCFWPFLTRCCAEAVRRPRRRDGQPERAQDRRRTRTDQGLRASVLYLPPTSPDLNPDRKGLVQAQIPSARAVRALPQPEHATAQALQTITPQNTQAWLRLRFGSYT